MGVGGGGGNLTRIDGGGNPGGGGIGFSTRVMETVFSFLSGILLYILPFSSTMISGSIGIVLIDRICSISVGIVSIRDTFSRNFSIIIFGRNTSKLNPPFFNLRYSSSSRLTESLVKCIN